MHDAFVEKGYMQARQNGIRVRAFEALPSMATFIAKLESRVVAVQSLAVDDRDLGLPSDLSFKPEIDRLRLGGALVCEATNQAVTPDYRNCSVPTELMRCLYSQAASVRCDKLITTISPGHVKFYELLGFHGISEVRSYSTEVEDPVVVMLLDMNSLAARLANVLPGEDTYEAWFQSYYVTSNPYTEFLDIWQFSADSFFKDPAALRSLFLVAAQLLQHCDTRERRVLEERWGPRVSADVFGQRAALEKVA